MKYLPSSRFLISILLFFVFLVFIVAVLFITNLSFSVWEQLQQKPDWIIWSYSGAVLFIALLFGRMVWRLLMPKRSHKKSEKEKKANNPPSIESTVHRLEEINQKISNQEYSLQKESSANSKEKLNASKTGGTQPESDFYDDLDISSPELLKIQNELKNYSQRKAQEYIYIALFGDISCGKSSLIKALINKAEVDNNDDSYTINTGVLGGTTREVVHYHWKLKGLLKSQELKSQELILTDMPGLNEQFSELDILSTEEVQRAHMVVYLCDGDLTATQFSELKHLLELKKPCVVAINKADRYSQSEQELIIENINQRIQPLSTTTPVLAISAGGMREFIRVTVDGEEERVQRQVPPDVQVLKNELLKILNQKSIDQLEELREKSVSFMVNNKLDDMEAHFKQSQSKRLVSSYTKKAVIASMATISPGTDLLVQGYLGIQMIKDLCKLYDVSATDIDANKLIELIQSRMDKTLPLLLAIAGNGLKAFPGIGTVSGGMMHAVAYGMIFDTLGRSVARTLEVTGELSPTLVSDLYKEQLGENIESRTKDFIKLVLRLRKSD
ncbi:MAG: hypothetical protein GY694_06800 [Gammaproteobacteria bacterium]|nr:hypothetical protein [Gammaproteobacteria bacterium]